MDSKQTKHQTPKWLTDELKDRVKQVFQPRYEHTLTESEIIEIAENFSTFFEHLVKYRRRQLYEHAN